MILLVLRVFHFETKKEKPKFLITNLCILLRKQKMVPREGLEPPCLAALDPKSSVSANFTSGAEISVYIETIKYSLYT